jgi:AcrR family transcriptional regulator
MNQMVGLRERKKVETRTAIQNAVLLLALARELDAVTADEIAAAANVSVRTFHNYFGSKEEALVAAWVSEFTIYVDALRDRPADEPILVSLEHVFTAIATAMEERPGEVEQHADLLWTSLGLARHRSVLLDEAIRMVSDVVAARTGTDPATEMYPHLVTAAAISAIVTTFQFAPSATTTVERERLIREAFALLRSGLQRGPEPPTEPPPGTARSAEPSATSPH